MKKENMHRLTFLIALPITLLFLYSQCNSSIKEETSLAQDSKELEEKQKGAHVFRINDKTNFQEYSKNNIEWIALVTWSSQENYDSPDLRYHYGDSLEELKRDSSWLHRIELVHDAGFKVFFKPHVWIDSPSDGKWRSDIYPSSEENWELWKESYRNFILRYARIAEQGKAEMFCVGAELSRLSTEKPLYWKKLIEEVRGIYSGEITYAANWYEEYDKITFWEDLDYIGIQAYFPLVKNKYPSVKQISKGWNKHISDIESVHKKYNRKILFTEMGYKSTADSGIKPWEWLEHSPKQAKSFSAETQANCYEAFFKTVWKKKWFVGVHIWCLHSSYTSSSEENDLDFTPQGKPAEQVIKKGFE